MGINLSIKTKVIFLVVVLLFATLGGLIWYDYNQTKHLIFNSETTYYQLVQETVDTAIDNQITNARHAVLGLADNPAIQQALARQDREQLASLVQPVFQSLKEEGISQLHFHLPPAISFYRAQKPEQHSDDLSSFRNTVVTCNKEKKIVQGLEEGVSGFGFRVVAPVFYQGEHIGSVEVGSNFGDNFAEAIKDSVSGEFYIYKITDSQVSGKDQFIGGTSTEDNLPLNMDVARQATQNNQMKFYNTNAQRTAVLVIPIEDYSGQVVGYLKAGLSRAEYAASLKKLLLSGVVSLLIGLAVGTVLLVIVLRVIFKPVEDLVGTTAEVSKGDLTVNIDVGSKDEVGKLALAFKEMVEHMREIILQISGKSHQVASSAQQLNAVSQQTAQNANENAIFMGDIAGGLDTVDNNINKIHEATQKAVGFAEEGKVAIEQLTAQMDKISISTGEVSEVVHQLNNKSVEINHIVELITDIASQTNLLALNATIEAARAGEQGRGFAVVAEEVRKLAEQSAEAANKIYHLIQDIQTEAQKAVENMSAGSKEVETGNKVVSEVGKSLLQIVNAVQSLGVEVGKISDASKQISGSVQDASAATEEQTAAVEEINASVEELSSICEDLNVMIQKFKI